MTKEEYQKLYVDIKELIDRINIFVNYNEYVIGDMKNTFTINEHIIFEDRFVEYSDLIDSVQNVLSNEIIPDLENKLSE